MSEEKEDTEVPDNDKETKKSEEDEEEDKEGEDKIELANKAAERLEKANTEHKKLIEREERLESQRIASGRSQSAPAQKPKEETAREYAEKVMKGENR